MKMLTRAQEDEPRAILPPLDLVGEGRRRRVEPDMDVGMGRAEGLGRVKVRPLARRMDHKRAKEVRTAPKACSRWAHGGGGIDRWRRACGQDEIRSLGEAEKKSGSFKGRRGRLQRREPHLKRRRA